MDIEIKRLDWPKAKIDEMADLTWESRLVLITADPLNNELWRCQQFLRKEDVN